jgi:two-component system cell cycle sensor histidine kinase/response regulator CckA
MQSSGSDERFLELRRRAQTFLKSPDDTATAMSPREMKKLVYELDTYQIELELQNEDLRYSQEQLLLSQKKYTDLYDFAPLGYLTVSAKGLIVDANLTAAEMLGVTKGEMLNLPFSVYIHPDDQDIYYLARKTLLEEKGTQTFELRMLKGNKTFFPAQLRSTCREDIDGICGQFRLALTDITKQKKAAEAIVKAKKEWEKTFDSITDIITILDGEMRIVRANQATYDFLQQEPATLLGKHCYEVYRGRNAVCPNCPRQEVLSGRGGHSANFTQDILGKIFLVSLASVQNGDNENSRIVLIAKDITSQKKMEIELFQARKMESIGTLAGGIAHDFNNILAAMLGFAELVKDNMAADNPSREDMEQILKAGVRAKDLVCQILTYSRKGMGEQMEMLQPSLVVKEALSLLRASMPTTMEIQQEIDDRCGTIIGNPTYIHQLLINICLNAIKAMADEKGILRVVLRRVELTASDLVDQENSTPRPFVELLVSDTGCGMDQRTMDRIFEPYFTTREFGQGSGMGLAVVHGIVQSCGGFIKAQSEPGRGSVFRVFFPIIRDSEEMESGVVKAQTLPISKGAERILVVDDEEAILRMYKKKLELQGYKVVTHGSSHKALEEIRRSPDAFDLVITDQTMPHFSGAELAQQILAIRPDIPIILCTGYSRMISEKKAKELGIAGFLQKPISGKELMASVREALDNLKVV